MDCRSEAIRGNTHFDMPLAAGVSPIYDRYGVTESAIELPG